ncbi:MAG: PQQ-binding-like beta-propeller repeat protein [Acidobacteriota bacterium]
MHRLPQIARFCAVLSLFGCQPASESGDRDWPAYLGDNGSSQSSPLQQIDRSNVGALEVAWTYRSGDATEGRSQVQCNPLVLGGVLYGTSAGLKLFALDAATGEELWVFDPFDGSYELFGAGVNRGLMAHGEGDELRLFYGAGDRLWAVRARDGQPDPGFADDGSLDLHTGLGDRAQDLFVVANTPGVVYEDLIILGHRTAESLPSAPGTIRAFDAVRGDLVWSFETIPAADVPGGETWPADAQERLGGANSWAGLALDEERGIVYVPTGSAAFDYWGGNRKGSNLYANTLLALDASTGDLLWHFQTVHHDIWDRDLPAPPNLLTVEHDGKKVDAVAQITKSAHVFLFDRVTGEPLFDVEERPVSQQAVPGEHPWPTQPIPTLPPPFARQQLTAENLNRLTPELAAWSEATFAGVVSGPPFTPPSLEGSVILPGLDGGGEWGGAAADAERGMLYVNASEMPWVLRLYEVQSGDARTTADLGRRTYARHCLSCHGVERHNPTDASMPDLRELAARLPESWTRRLLEQGRGRMPAFPFLEGDTLVNLLDFLYGRNVELPPRANSGGSYGSEGPRTLPYALVAFQRLANDEGLPLIEPPWGTLSAIDLNRGEIVWSVPHGDLETVDRKLLEPYGVERTGLEQYGGPVLTEGGLLFVAATKDEYLSAYDRDTGELLWRDRLPAAGYATPATYAVGGRQFVVVAAGGGKLGTPSSDAWVAYALPNSSPREGGP